MLLKTGVGVYSVTYLQFHFVFILPVIGLLVYLNWRDLNRGLPFTGEGWQGKRMALWSIPIYVLIALIYTTPWDNYLVYRQVWGYPEGRVLATIGYVPIEEYLFFILQTILTCLWVIYLTRREFKTRVVKHPNTVRLVGVVASLLIAAAGLLLMMVSWGTYLGLILLWAGPVLALQWGYGGDVLLAKWRILSLMIGLPTLYLWLADRIAIGLNIWWISPEFTTGFKPLGLPIEEAVFFLVTNVFIGFGMLLVLDGNSIKRLNAFRGLLKWQHAWRGALLLWVLSLVPMPLVPQFFPVVAYMSTVFLALGVLGYSLQRYGQKAWLLFAVSFLFGLGIEWLGKTTGFPFGSYDYTAPGPSLLGVPILVPLGWWAFTMIALAVTPKAYLYGLAPLALVAWDMGLDPIMVSNGFWVFERGIYYGIPMTNFLGWYLAGFVLIGLLLKLEPELKTENSLELRLAFLVQAFLLSVGLLFFAMPWASLLTFLAMGSFSFLAFKPKARLKLATES